MEYNIIKVQFKQKAYKKYFNKIFNHFSYTMFRQAFLLSDYSFIYEQYFKCSDT